MNIGFFNIKMYKSMHQVGNIQIIFSWKELKIEMLHLLLNGHTVQSKSWIQISTKLKKNNKFPFKNKENSYNHTA